MNSPAVISPASPESRAGAPRGWELLPWIAAAVAWAVFAWFTAPGMYWLDSQELGAAAAGLGVPHPTGFPLWTFIAHYASYLPVGELAFRIHLMSAASAACVAGLTAAILKRCLPPEPVSAWAIVAATGLLWSGVLLGRHGTLTEVYMPSVALLAFGGWALMRAVERPFDGASGLTLAFIAGIAATGAHALLRPALVVPAVLLLAWRLRQGARHPLAAPALAALGALALPLYLLVRSASRRIDLVDWGHPRTASALWDHLSAARIRDAFGDEMFSSVGDVVRTNAVTLARQLESSLGPIALLLATVGLVSGIKVRSTRFVALGAFVLVAGDWAYGAWVNPMGLVDGQNGQIASWALIVLAAIGVARVGLRMGRAAPHVAACAAFAAIMPSAWSAFGEQTAVANGDRARAWSEEAFLAAPPGAVAFVTSDSVAAGVLWLQAVEQSRPDVAVIVRQHIAIDPERTRAVMGRTGSQVSRAGGLPALLALAKADGRSVVWELGVDLAPAPVEPRVPVGQLHAQDPFSLDKSFERLAWIFHGDSFADPASTTTLAAALNRLGRVALGQKDVVRGEALFRAALATRPTHVEAWVNLGVVLSQRDDTAGALEATEQALQLAPLHPPALLNAARYAMALGKDARARAAAELVTQIDPDRALGWFLWGTALARAGERDRARAALQRALTLDPSMNDARLNLERLGPAPR